MPKNPNNPTPEEHEMLYESIKVFLHCDSCLKELPKGKSPAQYTSIEAGLIDDRNRIVLWCKRHKQVIGIFNLKKPLATTCQCDNPDCANHNLGIGEKPAFELGQTVSTVKVDELVKKDPKFQQWVAKCLQRHNYGDCGDMTEDDRLANFEAIMKGDARVFSSYNNTDLPDGRLWIITEADRSSTTILLPEDY